MRIFPDAKVLLTVRDAERWYESVKGSIYTANNYNQGTVGLFLKLVGQFRRMNIVLSTSNQGPPVNEKGKHVLIFLELGYTLGPENGRVQTIKIFHIHFCHCRPL